MNNVPLVIVLETHEDGKNGVMQLSIPVATHPDYVKLMMQMAVHHGTEKAEADEDQLMQLHEVEEGENLPADWCCNWKREKKP